MKKLQKFADSAKRISANSNLHATKQYLSLPIFFTLVCFSILFYFLAIFFFSVSKCNVCIQRLYSYTIVVYDIHNNLSFESKKAI